MPTDITPVDQFTAPVVVPVGTDDHNVLAEYMEAFVQALTNRTQYNYARAGERLLSQSARNEVLALTSMRQVLSHTAHLNGIAASFNGAGVGSLATVVAYGATGGILSRVAGGVFTVRTPGSGFASTFTDGCCGAGSLFVLVGNTGEIQSSADGVVFARRNTGGNNLKACAANVSGSVFVAVGENGSILSSVNGTTWNVRTNAYGTDPNVACIYVAALGLFVVTTSTGKIQTSPDGITWTARYTLAAPGVGFLNYQVHYSTKFGLVAMFYGPSPALGLAHSSDGISWTQTSTSSVSGIGSELTLRMALMNELFVYADTPTNVDGHVSLYTQTSTSFAPNSTATGCEVLVNVINDLLPSRAQFIGGCLWLSGENSAGSAGLLFSGGKAS